MTTLTYIRPLVKIVDDLTNDLTYILPLVKIADDLTSLKEGGPGSGPNPGEPHPHAGAGDGSKKYPYKLTRFPADPSVGKMAYDLLEIGDTQFYLTPTSAASRAVEKTLQPGSKVGTVDIWRPSDAPPDPASTRRVMLTGIRHMRAEGFTHLMAFPTNPGVETLLKRLGAKDASHGLLVLSLSSIKKEAWTPLLETAEEDAAERAAEKVRDWVNRRLDDGAMEIARLYRDNRDALVVKLRHIYENYLKDEPTIIKAKQIGATDAIARIVDTQVNDLAEELGSKSLDLMTEMTVAHPKIVNRWIAPLFSVEAPEILTPARTVLGELTTAVVGGGTYGDRLLNITQDTKDEIYSAVRSSLIAGSDFETLRGKIQDVFGVDKLPEPRSNAYGSVQIYRNEARRQWNGLMKDFADKPGQRGVWWAELDDATTPGCAARHGVPIDEIGDAPPRHFNCRCTIRIIAEDEETEDFQAEGADWLDANGYSQKSAYSKESLREGGPGSGPNLGEPHPHAGPGDSAKSLEDVVTGLGAEDTTPGPVTVKVFRVGKTEDKFGRGIYFGDSPASVEPYASGHAGEEIKEYTIQANNPVVAKNHRQLWNRMFSKNYNDSFYQQDQKTKDTVQTGRSMDKRLAAKVRAAGHDAIIFTAPPDPAKYEIAVINPKSAKIQISSQAKEGGPGSGPRHGQLHPHGGGDRFTSTTDPRVSQQTRDWVEKAGAYVNGIQDSPNRGEPGYLLFTDQKTGSTLMLSMNNLSKDAIEQKIKDKRHEFATAKKYESGIPSWGTTKLVPIIDVPDADPYDRSGLYCYAPMAFQAIPEWATRGGINQWAANPRMAKKYADPASVLARASLRVVREKPFVSGKNVEILTDTGWTPIRGKGRWIEVSPGTWALDGPTQASWTTKVYRPSQAVLQRYPNIAGLTARHQPGTVFHGAVVASDVSKYHALLAATKNDEAESVNSLSHQHYPALLDQLLLKVESGAHSGTHLVVWQVPDRQMLSEGGPGSGPNFGEPHPHAGPGGGAVSLEVSKERSQALHEQVKKASKAFSSGPGREDRDAAWAYGATPRAYDQRPQDWAMLDHTVSNSSIDDALSTLSSGVRWNTGSSVAGKEWLAAQALGGNDSLSRGTKEYLSEESRFGFGESDKKLTDGEKKAFAARREFVQAWFKKEYGESTTVYRGVSGTFAKKLVAGKEVGDTVDLPVYALSSWTPFKHLASDFASTKSGKLTGAVLKMTITADDVWAMPRDVGPQGVIRFSDDTGEIVILNTGKTRRVTVENKP